MMKLYGYIIVFLLSVQLQGRAQNIYDWIAPPSQDQLDMEGLDDIKGLGRLFMPAMTSSDYEPVYTVFQADTVVKVARMGRSVWLRPGRYIVAFGSGAMDQLIRKTVDIREEETRIIEPDWAGLTVRIIDESREWLKEPYEIYALPERSSHGIGYGADEQLGENLQTWILRPGLYKIVKLGEHVNTYINFATVRLMPGELTQYSIVMDSETRNYIGSGILLGETERKRIHNWNIFSAIYGSFTLNRANDVTTKQQQTSMAFVAQFDYNFKYSSPRHYFLARGLMEEGWNMQKRQSTFRSYLDNIRLKNLYIFYFFSGIGIYGRFFLDTNLFTTTYHYDRPTTVQLYDETGALREVISNVNDVELSPRFSPLELKEGIGINLLLIKSLRTNVNVRFGMGYRQNINRQLYTQDVSIATVFHRKSSSFLKGPEAALIGNIRIFRRMLINSELDILKPSDSPKIVFDWENNINLRLSKNISLDYTLRLKRDLSIVPYDQYEQILLLRYSYILF